MPDYNLGTAKGRLEIDASGVEQGAARARKSVKGFGDEAEKGGRRGAAAMGRAGTVTAAAGVSIVAAFALAVKSAASFESRLSAIQAVSGATDKAMEAVRAKALQLGKDTKFSASEAAIAIEELTKAGIPLPDVLNGAADAAVALAAAGEIDLPRAAEIASNAMNVFGLSAQEMPKVADLIAGAANASAIDVNEFGMSLQQAGAAANLAGVKFPDLATAIALMGNAGIKGSDAGTSLKTMLLNLNPATLKQTKLMKKLGIITEESGNRFFDAAGNAKSMSDIAGVLEDALSGMTKQQKLAALETLFGSDAIRAAAVIADNGSAGFDKMSASINKIKAADVAAKRMDNLQGRLEALKGSLETGAIVMGSVFIPILTRIVDAVTKLFNAFLELPQGVQTAIGFITLAIGVFLLVLGVVLKVISVVSLLGAAVTAGFAPFLIVGAIIAVIIAIAAAVFILYQRFQGVRDVVDTVGRALRTAFFAVLPIFQAIVAGVGQFVAGLRGAQTGAGGFLGFMNKLGNVIRTVVIPAIIAIGTFLLRTFGPVIMQAVSIVAGFVNGIVGYFRSILPQLTTIFNAIVAVIRFTFNLLAPIVVPIIKFILQYVVNTLKLLAIGISLVLNGVANIFRGIFNIIGGIIKVFLSLLTGNWRAAWQGVVQIVRGVLQIILGIIQTIIGGVIIGICISSLKTVGAIFKAGWSLVTGIVRGSINLVRSFIQGGMNFVSAIVRTVMNIVVGAFRTGWNLATGNVRAAVSSIRGIINTLQGVLMAVVRFFASMVGGVRSQIGSLLALVRGIPGQISGALGNLGGLLVAAGRAVISGLISGMTAMFGRLSDIASKVGGIISKVIPGSPVEEGPLRVLNHGYAGKQIVAMLAEGIDSNIGLLNRTARDLSSHLAAASVTPSANTLIATLPRTSLAARGGDGAAAPSVVYDVDVHNPPPVPGEQQVTDVLRRIETLYSPLQGVVGGG